MTKINNLLSMEEIIKLAELKESAIEKLNDVEAILGADKKFYMESFQVEKIDSLREKAEAIIAEAKARKAAKAAKIEADREYLDAKRREAKSNKRPLSKKARGIVTPLAPQNKNRGKGVAVPVAAKKDNSKATRNLVAINARPVTKASIAVKDLAIAKAQAEVKVAEAKKAYNALKVSASTSFKAIFSASEITRISAIELALFEVNDNLHDVLTSYEAICAELEEAKKVLNAEVENFNAVRNAVMKTVSTRTANKKASKKVSAIKEAKMAEGAEMLNRMVYGIAKSVTANKVAPFVGSQYSISKAIKATETNELLSVKYLETAECGSNMAVNINKNNNVSRGGINMNLQLLASKNKGDDKFIDINVLSPKCNEAHITNLNKRITKGLYNMNFVVERVNLLVNKNGKVVNQQFCYCLEGTVQQFRYFEVDTENTSYEVESYDGNGKLKDKTVRKTGIKNMPLNSPMVPAYITTDEDGNKMDWEACRKLSEDIIIFKIASKGSGRKVIRATERKAAKYSVKGVFVGEDENGNKVIYESLKELKASGNDIVGAYTGYFSSPSTLKHSVIFFVRLDVDIEQYSRVRLGIGSEEDKKAVRDARDARFAEIDETTQGALSYGIKNLENRRLSAKAGDEAVVPADYAKVFSRPGSVCATPIMPFGEMRNMFLIDTNILSAEEFTDADTRAIMNKMGIDNNFSDGSFITTVKQIRRSLESVGIDDVDDDKQIMSLGLQLRSGLILLKGFARVYDENMVYERAITLLELYAEYITVFCKQDAEYTSKGIAHKYTGKELLAMKNTNPAKFEFIIKDLDLMASSNEAKLINWEGLERPDAYAQLYLVDAQNASDSETSNQMLNKVLHYSEEEVKATMQAMVDTDCLNIANINKIKPIRLNRDCNSIGSMPSDAVKTLLGIDEAKKDASIMIKEYSTIVSSATSKIARARIDSKSPYMVAVPDDYMLGSYFDKDGNYIPLNILGVRDVKDYTPVEIKEGKDGKTIQCIEIYSVRENIKISKEIKKLRENGMYSDEDMAKIENSLRIQTMLKYPTQGRDEYVFVYYVSNREIRDRIYDARDIGLISDSRAKALLNFYFRNPLSCVVIAADNTLKNQLAGFDFDGDAVITVPRSLSKADDETGEVVYGVYDALHDKVLNDYTSILINKYADNDYKYTGTCIVYDKTESVYDEKPVYIKSKVRSASVENNNRKITDAQKCLGDAIFGYDAIDFLEKSVVENYVPIVDYLGLYHASNTVGDNIGMTIVLCSVPIMASIDELFDEKGVMDYELFQEIFEPLHPGKTTGKYNNKPYIRYSSVFTETPDSDGIIRKKVAVNRFGREVICYRVSKAVVKDFCYRVAHLRKETTIEEWKILVDDFNHITRALGESSIDCKKDVTKTLGKDVYDIINMNVRCYGNIKKDDIDSNYQNIYNKDSANKAFEFDFSDFEGNDIVGEGGKDPKYLLYNDAIGDIKFDIMADTYEGSIDRVRQEIVENSNYDYYKDNYGKLDADGDTLADKYPNTDDANHTYIVYALNAAKPKNGLTKLNKYEKQLVLNGLYNLADLDGMDVKNDPTVLVKLAIEDAFVNYNYNPDYEDNNEPRFDFADGYNNKLNTVINVYNEMFIMERTGLKRIPVELQMALDCKIDEKHEGHNLSFVHGVCESDESLIVKDDFTGSAKCENGKLIVYYDPTLKLFKDSSVLTLSIDSFAKDDNSNPKDQNNFKATGDEIYEGQSYGFETINNKESELRFGKVDIVDQYGDHIVKLSLEDEDNNTVAIFDQYVEEGLETLVGKKFSGCMLVGNTYEVEERVVDPITGKRLRKKATVRKYNYLVNGYVSF